MHRRILDAVHPRGCTDGRRQPTATLLARRDVELRILAIHTLREIGYPPSVPALIDALNDPVDEVRTTAHQALREITREDHDPDPELWRLVIYK